MLVLQKLVILCWICFKKKLNVMILSGYFLMNFICIKHFIILATHDMSQKDKLIIYLFI